MSTRVSLTTMAMARADVPASCAVATTCPTSCTPAPTQWPNCSALRPSGCQNNGSTAIASVPQRVTSATGVAVSLSLAFTTPLMAPIADAPQMAKPVAISSGWWPGRRSRRPSQSVMPKVRSTTAATEVMVTQPRPAISTRLRFRPSSTIPRRMKRFAATDNPGARNPESDASAAGSWATMMPKATAAVSRGTAGSTA